MSDVADDETVECPECGRESRSGVFRDDDLCIVCLDKAEEMGEL